MAEGWARHLKGDRIEAHSAGIDAGGVNPIVVKIMAEAGVNIVIPAVVSSAVTFRAVS